jgi:hypothetical protein
LYTKVKQYFPDSALKLVGGFLFLRFFCPAILAPHNFGLVDGTAASLLSFRLFFAYDVHEPPSGTAEQTAKRFVRRALQSPHRQRPSDT